MRKLTVSLTTMCLVASANVFAIEVGSIDDSRFGTGYTLNGSQLVPTREKLLNQDNFGPGGTVDDIINITDVAGPITHTALSTFDVFFIGYLDDGDADAFTAEELQAFEDWVDAGGTMVITCDSTSFDAVCNQFGPIPSGPIDPPVNPTVAGDSHPVFDGPFGSPNQLEMSGTQTSFNNITGFTVLGDDQDGNPVVIEDLRGDGRVILFTDVDIISSARLSDGPGISNDNDQFLGNLFAYLGASAEETFSMNGGINGNWWYGPERAGEGAQLEVVISGGNLTLVANFYGYNGVNGQIFLIAVGEVVGNVAEVDVYITSGGFWGDLFDPGDINEEVWGTGTFTATSCNTVNMELNPNVQHQALGYSDLAYPLKRLNPPAAPCPIANPD